MEREKSKWRGKRANGEGKEQMEEEKKLKRRGKNIGMGRGNCASDNQISNISNDAARHSKKSVSESVCGPVLAVG